MSAPEEQTKVLAEDAKAEIEAAGEPGNQGSEMQLQEAGHDGTSQPATTSVQPRSGLNEDTGDGMHAGRVDGVEQHGQQGQGDGQDEQNQGNHDPEVQEEIVSSFTEGKKRVKVYELRGQAWEDKGTGFVEGIYDEASDEALLVVTREDAREEESRATEQAEEQGGPSEDEEGNVLPGGFLREGEDPFLLRSKVGKTESYSRQQETLIVWTEPNGVDVALSFQDPEGCNNIWDFIQEVQRHLQLIYDDQVPMSGSSSSPSSPMPASPQLGQEQMNQMYAEREGRGWSPLSLSNLREQETALKLSSRSIAGREKTVEFVITNDYVRQMIKVFNDAEDMESLDDLHSLCTMMSTILSLNDNGLYEYLLQEDVFLGMAGIMEYDPDYPTYKASYRDFLSEGSRFKEVVPIADDTIRAKIHQTYRLLYLKDVILARVLDDPMFNILNSLLFFNQIDIITHIASNDRFLTELFSGFKEHKLKTSVPLGKPVTTPAPEALKEEDITRRNDVVALLHQLMLMGKQVQLQHRQQLYRTLIERGLLFVCEWALKQEDSTVLNQVAEILSIVIDHDVNAVRTHALREHAEKRKTIAEDMTSLLLSSPDLGLKSQMADAIRTLVDIGGEGSEIPNIIRSQRDQATGDAFLGYFYEACIIDMYRPLLELPDFKAYKAKGAVLTPAQIMLMQYLSELLASFVAQHGHRAQFFILSNPVSMRIASLLYMKQKPLRHASLRYFKACLKASSHFIHRHLIKYELMSPTLDLLESESPRDNMLCSACLDIFEVIRKDNLKPMINYLFEKYKPRLQALAENPLLKPYIHALATRWEQNNEPLPSTQTAHSDESGSFSKTMDTTEDDYFNGESDDEEIGPTPPPPPALLSASPMGGQKRKRPGDLDQVATTPPTKSTKLAGGRALSGGVLGLDYDDGSDSDSSEASPQTPGRQALRPSAPIQNESTNSLAPSPMKDAPTSNAQSSPVNRIKIKLGSPSTPAGEDLDEIASRMAKKRKQETEQDDDSFGSLLEGNKVAPPKTVKAEQTPNIREKPPSGVVGLGLAMKDAGKKLKINLFGKKSTQDSDKKKSGSPNPP